MLLASFRDRSSGVLRCFVVTALIALAVGMRVPPSAEAEGFARAAAGRCHAHKVTAKVRRFTRAVLCMHNFERRAHGLPRLRASRTLHRAALRHARDMVRKHYFDHVSFGGRTVMDRVARAGYGRRRYSAGENIFYGMAPRPTPARVVAAWMAAASHRHQLLNPGWRDLGIGAIMRPPFGGRGGVTVVAVFGAHGARR
jgi:uncharacterized protein YkwD